ncbi:MAG: phytoene/squalene synthase family protein [Candidatus Microsaccharimonas sossegonensis]|uniref:Phytoene/squalene synthase family protein n=1 Tax=Candidatus Microsaccharimonas sossegonensis TaxID=2506948 RepID=A0A4Q0AI21_9BACT|nr:MAG: phytoene/squalene synthase family protein [Candidatus Microsaccharimonas sossegonensis]
MDRYTAASYKASKLITTTYSTSFGLSIRLFAASLRPHIYAIYGFVRIADEIVDTYKGANQRDLLNNLEAEIKQTLRSGYSTNPIIHAFASTARQFAIDNTLITPFFESMRMDLVPQHFDQKRYETYIYGSAEVVGLMCLKIFTNHTSLYDSLKTGAKHLGAAYQKINFLRDIAADAKGLGRWYFPIGSFETFDKDAKNTIEKDIEHDLALAAKAIAKLPSSSRKAVQLSYQYYRELLKIIKQTSSASLKQNRLRVNDLKKAALFLRNSLGRESD